MVHEVIGATFTYESLFSTGAGWVPLFGGTLSATEAAY
jgi:hypothetical protein